MTVFLNPARPSFPEPPYTDTVPPNLLKFSFIVRSLSWLFCSRKHEEYCIIPSWDGQPSPAGVLVLCFSLLPLFLAVLVDRAMILENVFCMSVPPLKNLYFPYLYNSGLTLYHRIRKPDHTLEFICCTISHNTDRQSTSDLKGNSLSFDVIVLTSMATVSLVSWLRVWLTKIP